MTDESGPFVISYPDVGSGAIDPIITHVNKKPNKNQTTALLPRHLAQFDREGWAQ